MAFYYKSINLCDSSDCIVCFKIWKNVGEMGKILPKNYEENQFTCMFSPVYQHYYFDIVIT